MELVAAACLAFLAESGAYPFEQIAPAICGVHTAAKDRVNKLKDGGVDNED